MTWDDDTAGRGGRRLRASGSCSIEFCQASGCVWRRNAWRCTTCTDGYQPSKQGTTCECPPGKFAVALGCSSCPMGCYCPGLGSSQVQCPGVLTTARRGAKGLQDCVNPPGYYLAVGPSARPCGRDEYGEGLRKQASCTPCPTGTMTDPRNPIGTQTSSASCKAGPGYMIVAGALVPCPVGSFKDSYSDPGASCVTCLATRGPGLTTSSSGSTSLADCAYVEPGYAPADARKTVIMSGVGLSDDAVKGAGPCPQGFYCPGGYLALPVKCPAGLITRDEGATSSTQCVAPPGYAFNGTAGVECGNGFFKPSYSNKAACTPCGDNPATSEDVTDTTVGWKSSRSSFITIKDPNNGRNIVWGLTRGTRSSCFLRPGLGAFKVGRPGPWTAALSRAVLCPPGSYGSSSERRLDVDPAFSCNSCPTHQVTSCAGVADPAACIARLAPHAVNYTNGTAYTSSMACVHLPGYGWVSPDNSSNSALYSLPCPARSWSPGGHNDSCTACLSNAVSTSQGATSLEQCYTLSAGFAAKNAAGQPILSAVTNFNTIAGTVACPVNYYCLGGSPAADGIPQACPLGTSTAFNGSTSAADCQ